MNLRFSKQSKRKPIYTNDVTESRFEIFDAFPKSLAKNKNLIWNIKFDKFAERNIHMEKKGPAPEYDPVDPEKYKF